MIAAGKLNKRILLKRRQLERDSAGEMRESFTDAGLVWAQVKAVAQAEQTQVNATASITQFEFIIRYRPEIETSWKIDYRGQLLSISSITDPDQTKVKLSIIAYAPRT